MKKLLFVLLAVLMSTVSFAQFAAAPRCLDLNQAKGVNDFPVWQEINTPFVAVDVYGDTVDLGAILASGHGVVIDYSGYWCGPCWNVHTSGILEAIDEIANVDVIWVETTSGTTMNELDGTSSNSYGDWLHTTSGDAVPYPVIIDANNGGACLATCSAFYNNAVPMILFIAPNGYACDIYGYDYGIYSFNPSAVAANVTALMSAYPQAGQAPIAGIAGPTAVTINSAATFTAQVTSVDPITSYSWSVDGGTPNSGSSNSITTTFATAGNHTVTLTVANANGSTTATLNVNVIEWNWGATMSYWTNEEFQSGFGFSQSYYNTYRFYWGSKYPADKLAGRAYLSNVEIYVPTNNGSVAAGSYTLDVHQGATPNASNKIYTRTVTLSNAGWNTINVEGDVAIDATKDLWVTFNTLGVAYSAAMAESCGDENGSYLSQDGSEWSKLSEVGYEGTWMMKATTADHGNPASINTISNVNINLYPNPTTGILNINAEGVQEVSVIDMDGRVVMNERNANAINMSELSNGVYFVRVITNAGVDTQKIVKK